MALDRVRTPSEGPPRPIAWAAHRLHTAGGERGQALILTTAAMFVVLAMAAFSIDLATWYQKHHQAQVAADSAALAAANCLANGKTTNRDCTSATDTVDAQNVATTIATTNLPTSTDQVTIDTTAHTVTVVSKASPQVAFAGLINVRPTVVARAVASYSAPLANYSVFVGNNTCNAGTGLQIGSFGGGNATVTGLYSDGVIDNNDNSGSAVYSGGISNGATSGGWNIGGTPLCGNGQGTAGTLSNDNLWQTKNTTVVTGQETAYPVQYSEPTFQATGQYATITNTYPSAPASWTPGICTYASNYFSTDGTGMHQIRWPGIYCITDSSGNLVTSYSANSNYCGTVSGNHATSDKTDGSIYINSTLQGSYEFVGPCVVGDSVLSSSLNTVSTMAPLIYGTAQTGNASTVPCLDPATTYVNPNAIVNSPDNVFLYNNNLTLNGAIYSPCGTTELYKNNDYNAFIESANVTIDKNNFTAWNGTGPSSAPATSGMTG